ncbi:MULTISPECIES: penicillin-binding protein 2 [Anaerolinea]|uniref:peptidoglycan D,D-transpeptidase FtsI family protein n=1 Tax=Anaerolinea TaxID=233189 RepID=UPI002624FAC5|nr:penicillin-binding protein 2 [Anaerolinea thermophila]
MNSEHSFIRYQITGALLTAVGLFAFIWMIRILSNPQAPELLQQGENYRIYEQTIYPVRGNIYDRWGNLLAGNLETYEVGADLRYVEDPETIATVLSTHLGLKYGDILETLKAYSTNIDEETPRYVRLANFVPAEQIALLEKEQERLEEESKKRRLRKGEIAPTLSGLQWSRTMARYYPEGSLASNVLGFYAYMQEEDARGYYGLEEKYNDLLTGTPMKVRWSLDPSLVPEVPNLPPGASLITTIDRNIQKMVEEKLDDAVKNTGSLSGTVIIMDPESGEILAMAVSPRFNPNEYWNIQNVFGEKMNVNRAIDTVYEPGSTFKPITMASAIDAGVVEPSTPFLDTGVYYIKGHAIRNWDRGAWGPQDMTGCLRYSLNVCMAWIADQMGTTRFYEYVNRFGFGHLTGIDLAGEVTQPYFTPGDTYWSDINLGTNSFGQAIAVTPLQMITALNALANHGKIVAPHVVKAIIQNNEKYEVSTQVISRPIKAETADTVSQMLAESVESESYKNAQVPGYRIAGKTGTAEVYDPIHGGYKDGVTNASFVGWGPVDDPRFIVYVWLEEPRSSPWGSMVAAPLFRDIVQGLVVLMDLPPDEVRWQIANH